MVFYSYKGQHFQTDFWVCSLCWEKHWIWILDLKNCIQEKTNLFQTACPELVLFNSSRQTILHTMSRIQEFSTYRFLLSDIQNHSALWSTTSASHTPIMYFISSRFEAGWPPNRLLQGIVPIDHMSGEDLPYHQPWKQSLSQSGYSCSRLGQSSC